MFLLLTQYYWNVQQVTVSQQIYKIKTKNTNFKVKAIYDLPGIYNYQQGTARMCSDGPFFKKVKYSLLCVQVQLFVWNWVSID